MCWLHRRSSLFQLFVRLNPCGYEVGGLGLGSDFYSILLSIIKYYYIYYLWNHYRIIILSYNYLI